MATNRMMKKKITQALWGCMGLVVSAWCQASSSPISVQVNITATVVSPTCSLQSSPSEYQNGIITHAYGTLYSDSGRQTKSSRLAYRCDGLLASVAVALSGGSRSKVLQDDNVAKVELAVSSVIETDKQGFGVIVDSAVTPHSSGTVNKIDTLVITYS